MTALLKYDTAKQALAEARTFKDVESIKNAAEARAAWARIAKDTEMVAWATEIRVRAERKAGEMLASMTKATGGDAARARFPRGTESNDAPITLSELGVSKKEAHRWQKLGRVPDEKFEAAIAETRSNDGIVTTGKILRVTSEDTKPFVPEPKKPPVIDVPPAVDDIPEGELTVDDLRRELKESLLEAQALADENAQLRKVLAEDDAAKAAWVELEKVKALNRALESTNKLLMTEKAEALAALKKERTRRERIEKEHAKCKS